jgi:hypothetical protein
VSPEHGLTDYNTGEVQVKRQMMKCAKKVIVLADHSKFGRVAPLKIADLTSVHQIITDEGITEADQRAVESFGVEVVVAGRPGARGAAAQNTLKQGALSLERRSATELSMQPVGGPLSKGPINSVSPEVQA